MRAFPAGRCLRTSPARRGLRGRPVLVGRVTAPDHPPRRGRGRRLALTSELVSSDPRWTLTPGSRAAGRAMHAGQAEGRPPGPSLCREGGGIRRRREEEREQGRTSGWRQRGSASTVPGGLPRRRRRRRRRCCGRGRNGAAGVSARSGPGAALSSGGSGPSRGERRLAAGAGSGCCSWDPAWKSEKDTPSTTAGSQMKTSGLL